MIYRWYLICIKIQQPFNDPIKRPWTTLKYQSSIYVTSTMWLSVGSTRYSGNAQVKILSTPWKLETLDTETMNDIFYQTSNPARLTLRADQLIYTFFAQAFDERCLWAAPCNEGERRTVLGNIFRWHVIAAQRMLERGKKWRRGGSNEGACRLHAVCRCGARRDICWRHINLLKRNKELKNPHNILVILFPHNVIVFLIEH